MRMTVRLAMRLVMRLAMRLVMRLGRIYLHGMGMQVMRVVDMLVGVGVRAVRMQVPMLLGQMQPHAPPHQDTGSNKLPGDGF